MSELVNVIDSRGRLLTPCRRKVAEREVRLNRAKWIGPNRIRLRFDPFAYRYIRLKVLERDKYTCYWCGNPGDTMDHVIPWSKGGRTTMDNCICACQECNGQRGDMPAEQFALLRHVAVPQVLGGVVTAPRVEGAPELLEPIDEELPMAAGAPALVAIPRSPAMGRLLDPYAPSLSRRVFY